MLLCGQLEKWARSRKKSLCEKSLQLFSKRVNGKIRASHNPSLSVVCIPAIPEKLPVFPFLF